MNERVCKIYQVYTGYVISDSISQVSCPHDGIAGLTIQDLVYGVVVWRLLGGCLTTLTAA